MIFTPKASRILKYTSALIFAVVLFVVGFYGNIVRADHADQFKGRGYAYGSIDDNEDNSADTGIGYLSFGCETDVGGACENTATENFPSGYGVRINTNPDSPDEGKFFGYAWSSNYGWVSFYHSDVAGCGAGGGLEIPGDVQEFIHSGQSVVLDGWAKVLNQNDSKSDGCIRFGEEAVNGFAEPARLTAVSPDNLVMSGWAYGSPLIGWVSFDCEDCRVYFNPVDEECDEADDSEECNPEGGAPPNLSLSIGGPEQSPLVILGNSTYIVPVTDINNSEEVVLIPTSGGQDVQNCSATYSSSGSGTASPWSGIILDSLPVGDVTNDFSVNLDNYAINEIYTFEIECESVLDGTILSAQAFAIMQFPPASVDISASPNPIDIGSDPTGSTTLSWTFGNVQNNSCEIVGFVDTTPAIEDDPVESMSPAFMDSINFSSSNPNSPGTDGLSGIINFPVYFEITCLSYADQEVSDGVYITTTDLGCTPSMEAAGYCSDDINPIFEEF